MTVLTALPVQNTTGVQSCYGIPLQAIEEQLKMIFSDIVPDAIKIGMLFTSEIIELVAAFLKENSVNIPIILDPVMCAKSGDRLLLEEAVSALKKKLIPIATIITPNLPEAYELVGKGFLFEELANKILDLGPKAVFLKGGHLDGKFSKDLLLMQDGTKLCLSATRVKSKNTHGTGCTLSAAITSGLALGMTLPESCYIAKKYLTSAIKAASNDYVGKGNGPINHFYHLWPCIDKIHQGIMMK